MRKAQYAMVIDSSKCIDCKACVVSCKVANNTPEGFSRNWIKASEPDFAAGTKPVTHFQPGACMHCEAPTCVDACPTGATYKNADGIVMIDETLCIGCGNCIPSCPYGARFRNPQKRTADKCNYCPERRAAGLLPACVDTCPTKARVFGDIMNPESDAARLLEQHKDHVVQVINQKSNTAPHMYYLASTAPVDWTHEAVMPASMATMTDVVDPVVKTFVGLSGLGVLVMLGRQLLLGHDSGHDSSHDSGNDGGHDGHTGPDAPAGHAHKQETDKK